MENSSFPCLKWNWIIDIIKVILTLVAVGAAVWGVYYAHQAVLSSNRSVRDAQLARRCYLAPAHKTLTRLLDPSTKNITGIEIQIKNYGINPARDTKVCVAIFNNSYNQISKDPCVESKNPIPKGQTATIRTMLLEGSILKTDDIYFVWAKARYHDPMLDSIYTDQYTWVLKKSLTTGKLELSDRSVPEIDAKLKEMGKDIWQNYNYVQGEKTGRNGDPTVY